MTKTATKQTKKTTTTKAENTNKTFTLSARNKKLAIAAILLTTTVVSGFILLKQQNNVSILEETQINTPVIARTELSKKPAIEIKVFDEKENYATELDKATDKPLAAETKVKVVEPTTTSHDVEAVIANLTKIELAQNQLKAELEKVKASANPQAIATIEEKVKKLESLNGNIGNMSKIFLAQQLVLLDNAFKVGGNQNIAIENIHNFASKVAKDEKVSAKLQNLLEITKQEAIITPHALVFYAQKLETIELENTHIEEKQVAKDASIAEKIKAFLQSFIIIRKQDEVTAEQEYWNKSIDEIEKSIIFGDFVTVTKLLEDEQLKTLGGEDFVNFTNLFNNYLKQQQALQATLGAFIEGYNYDY
ncbi:MAG: hypothetical protein CFH44_00295 [Proteobacteria bacterium]|nr:MAG: hypothetical protein CFH44_00295 [Pseudomonadota bacterium]